MGAGERLSIPTSLTDLVSARLAALSADVREVLEPVALLSEPTVSLVEAVASDGEAVRGRLRAAEAAAIVEMNEERVRFSHPLLAARVEAELDPRGGDRCIAGSRNSSATRSSAPGILLSARTGPPRGSPGNWRTLP